MHVLLLAPGLTPHARALVDELLAAGHRVTFLDRHNPRSDCPAGYNYLPFPGIPGAHRLNPRVAGMVEPWVRAAQVRYIWNKYRPDVVNVQGVDGRTVWCARAGVRPLVLTCWGSDINDLFEARTEDPGYRQRLGSMVGGLYDQPARRELAVSLYRKRIAEALRAADRVTVVNPQVLRRCEELSGRRLPAHYFRVGTDFLQFRPGYSGEASRLRQDLGIPTGTRVLLSSRILQPLMGHGHILRAFAALAADRALGDLVLVMKEYLAYPDESARVRALGKELGVEGKVIWLEDLGPAHLHLQYALADTVINYPDQDGFPVSLFEAAGSGRPIVCSDLPAYEGVFGDSIITAPPGDPTALAGAIRRSLLESPAETARRTAEARRIAHAEGDRSRNFESLVGVFRSALKQHRRRTG